MWNDFLSLIYPRLCPGCNEVMMKNEIGVCAFCLMDFPKTNFYKDCSNPVAKLFWGRIEVQRAFSSYLFINESKIQKVIHSLKYNGNKKVGEIFGIEIAKELIKIKELKKIDVIIPVPIDKTKKRKRGYNQSLVIANGISSVLKIPVIENILLRKTQSVSQTNKARFQRWENVKNIFYVSNEDTLEKKHVLIVDDVITSGATIIACSEALNNIKGISLSVSTVAYTRNN